jgi:hypothetical protein
LETASRVDEWRGGLGRSLFYPVARHFGCGQRYTGDTHKTPRYTERYQSDPEPVASGSRRAASARPIALRSGNGRAKDVLMRRSSAGGSLDLPDDGARSREFSALQGRIGASRRRLGNCGWERSP